MKTAICTLKSTSPYSQGKYHQAPEKPKEGKGIDNSINTLLFELEELRQRLHEILTRLSPMLIEDDTVMTAVQELPGGTSPLSVTINEAVLRIRAASCTSNEILRRLDIA